MFRYHLPCCITCFCTSKLFWHAKNYLVKSQKFWDWGDPFPYVGKNSQIIPYFFLEASLMVNVMDDNMILTTIKLSYSHCFCVRIRRKKPLARRRNKRRTTLLVLKKHIFWEPNIDKSEIIIVTRNTRITWARSIIWSLLHCWCFCDFEQLWWHCGVGRKGKRAFEQLLDKLLSSTNPLLWPSVLQPLYHNLKSNC